MSSGLLFFTMSTLSNCGMEPIFSASLKTKKEILKVNILCAYNNSAPEEPKTNEASKTLNYMKQNTALDKNQHGYSDVHLDV